jgi:hypothetical protein
LPGPAEPVSIQVKRPGCRVFDCEIERCGSGIAGEKMEKMKRSRKRWSGRRLNSPRNPWPGNGAESYGKAKKNHNKPEGICLALFAPGFRSF